MGSHISIVSSGITTLLMTFSDLWRSFGYCLLFKTTVSKRRNIQHEHNYTLYLLRDNEQEFLHILIFTLTLT